VGLAGAHVLRHAAATLLSAGVPVAAVSAILGHARTSITYDVYAHSMPEATSSAVQRLSDAIALDSNRDSNAVEK
jgi:integrase